MPSTAIGTNLRRTMDQQHWQQSDLAKRCHLSEATISRILSGEQPNPTARTLQALANALGCRVSLLLAEEPGAGTTSETAEAVLLELYRLLPSDERTKIVEYAEAIAIKRERDQYLARHPEASRRRTDSLLPRSRFREHLVLS